MKQLIFLFLVFSLIPLSFAQEDEDIIQEIEKEREEHQAQVEQIASPVEKLEEAKEKVLTIDDVLSDKFTALIEENLKNSPLKTMEREEVKKVLRAKVAGKPMAKIFRLFPPSLEMAVDLVRDDKAILGLLRMAKREKEIMNFTGIWVVLVISFWMLKKRIAPKTVSFRRRFVFKTALTILGSMISFSIFYIMFGDDLDPTLSIIFRHLL